MGFSAMFLQIHHFLQMRIVQNIIDNLSKTLYIDAWMFDNWLIFRATSRNNIYSTDDLRTIFPTHNENERKLING